MEYIYFNNNVDNKGYMVEEANILNALYYTNYYKEWLRKEKERIEQEKKNQEKE